MNLNFEIHCTCGNNKFRRSKQIIVTEDNIIKILDSLQGLKKHCWDVKCTTCGKILRIYLAINNNK